MNPGRPEDLRMSQAETDAAAGVLEEARVNAAEKLKGIIADARAGKPDAVRKLKLYGSITDPALATKMVLMNRSQRQAYVGSMKKARGKIRARDLGGAGKKEKKR